MTTPATPRTEADWRAVLARLVTAGAELAVTDPDGTLAYRAPLARHHRTEENHPIVWIRPSPNRPHVRPVIDWTEPGKAPSTDESGVRWCRHWCNLDTDGSACIGGR